MADSDPPNEFSADPSPRFDDDVDTVPQCTGECCDPVTVMGSEYVAMSRSPGSYRNGRYMVNMLKARGPVAQHGTVEFTCKYFDLESRRCVAYDRRPQMCRDFPEEGVCGYCGGRFATGQHAQPEADTAGGDPVEMARMRAMRTLIGLEMGRIGESAGTSMRIQKKSR